MERLARAHAAEAEERPRDAVIGFYNGYTPTTGNEPTPSGVCG
jgi:hypothetical protein